MRSASSSDLGSDFAECVEEYSVDSDGNPKNAPPIDGDFQQGGDKDEQGEKKSIEERRKEKRLAKLDKRIKSAMKKHEKEKNVKMA